jgi:DNA-binding transcriptional MerR regulator
MTHFTVGIIIPACVTPDKIEHFAAEAMAPYDESLTVAPYVSYSLAKARIELKADITRLERIIEQRTSGYNLEKCRESLEQLRETSPEDKYRDYVAHHERFNAKGQPTSTYNPNSKWDWYVIGGRWDGWINDRDSSQEAVADNIASTSEAVQRNRIPHALLTPDGEWHEHGQMGWWGVMLTENEGWDADARAILAGYPDHNVLILDAHI